jgi:hypothetical protein
MHTAYPPVHNAIEYTYREYTYREYTYREYTYREYTYRDLLFRLLPRRAKSSPQWPGAMFSGCLALKVVTTTGKRVRAEYLKGLMNRF